ncbi:MAG: ABC transporter permease [Christensenellales bacterium]
MKSNVKKISNNYFISGIKGYFRLHYGGILGLALLCLIVTVFAPNFFTLGNFINILRQISVYGILAISLTIVLLCAGVDLSVGATVAASGCLVLALYLNMSIPLWLSILITLAVCIIIGFFNGFLVANTKLPCFIITLATQMIIRGFGYLFTQGYPITTNDVPFSEIGVGSIKIFSNGIQVFEVPYSVIIMCILFFVFWFILSRTKFGREIYAVGGNAEAARCSGINVKKVRTIAFIISSTLAGIAGIILASRMYSGQPTIGVGYEGEAIAASVLGGISFSGGVGTLGGTLIGSFIMGVVNNGMNMLKLDYYYQFIVKGTVILIAVLLDSMKGTSSSTKRNIIGKLLKRGKSL